LSRSNSFQSLTLLLDMYNTWRPAHTDTGEGVPTQPHRGQCTHFALSQHIAALELFNLVV
jgi:hypothetical protein